MQLIVLWAMFFGRADAAEVVWLSEPPTPEAAARVAAAAGATGAPLAAIDLRAAATRFGPADELAYANLERAVRDVRQYETRLDGELVIMDDLAKPIAAVTVVRDDADRGALFSALAYQGFAIDRYFEATIATDERAAPYRAEVEGAWLARPWVDAVGLDPDREVTPYDIAEAPQRVAYGKARDAVRRVVPARLEPGKLPAGARLVVDGRPAQPGAAGTIAVMPSRHLVHVELDGRIVARWDLRLSPGEKRVLEVALDDDTWRAWADALAAGTAAPVPVALAPSLDALGGEVVVAGARGTDVYAWKVTRDGVAPLDVAAARRSASGGDGAAWTMAAGLTGGWLSSGDFYTQNPREVPRTSASVNAGTAGLTVGVARDAGMLRFGAGLDAPVTLGANHVAFTGAAKTRLRLHPHLAFGVRPAQVTVGYLFPYHPSVGVRAAVPLPGTLEAVAGWSYGVPVDRERADGTTWDALPVYTGWGGLAWRFGVRP